MDPAIVRTIALSAIFILVLVVLPIVVLLLEHQRKMARLMRGEKLEENDQTLAVLMGAGKIESNPGLEARVAALEAEVAVLRGALAPRTESEPAISERLHI